MKQFGWFLTLVQFGFYSVFGIVETSFKNDKSRKWVAQNLKPGANKKGSHLYHFKWPVSKPLFLQLWPDLPFGNHPIKKY